MIVDQYVTYQIMTESPDSTLMIYLRSIPIFIEFMQKAENLIAIIFKLNKRLTDQANGCTEHYKASFSYLINF